MSLRALEKARQRDARRTEMSLRRLQQIARQASVPRRDYAGPDEADFADDA